ncbi:MAG: FKBP-type peptidyl-prolyl cis-trans isomerase [Pirellulales bacterium]
MRTRLAPLAVVLGLVLMAVVYSQDTPPQAAPAPQAEASAPADPATYRQQVSYALGRNFGQNLRDSEIEIELQSLMAGVGDVLSGAQPKWSEAQLQATLQRFGQEMQQKAVARQQRQAGKNSQEAKAFLAQNGKREDVQTTASGLQYRVLRQGDGQSPTVEDTVRCNYRGALLDGTEFDSSARHGGPAEFPVNGVIPGWTEALQKMKVGDKWQLFVPPKLAYAENPPGPPIEPNSLLVFEIELLEVVPQ